jgi:hypothetical protein
MNLMVARALGGALARPAGEREDDDWKELVPSLPRDRRECVRRRACRKVVSEQRGGDGVEG